MAWTYCSDTEVLSLEAKAAKEWLASIEAGDQVSPAEFDWPALAQGAALRARLNDGDESLIWALLAVDVFQKLAADQPTKTYDASEMYCRAAMIEKHGALAGDPLRDPACIFAWFRESLGSDLTGTKALIQRLWDDRSEEFENCVVKPLQQLKNRINVIKSLPDECHAPDDVSAYVALWGELP